MRRLAETSISVLTWLRINSKRGVSAIEYGILAALIAVVIIGAVTAVGTNLKGVFTTISKDVHG
jgi:pilus assembly protein Flp/PilA